MKIYIRALHLWNMDPPGAKSPIRAPARGACLILTGSGYSFPGRQLGPAIWTKTQNFIFISQVILLTLRYKRLSLPNN
jgi:hypothetical protein